MTRRELLVLMASAMTVARPVRAQQKAMPVIGFLGAGSPGSQAALTAAFREGLAEAGYVEGQNVTIEYRWAEGRLDRLPALAADLVERKVDMIAAMAGTPPAVAAKGATSTIPIVFSGGDPVERGLVASLARPGGNLTGVSSLDLAPKRLEMLSELVPGAKLIALLVNPNNPFAESTTKNAQEAAHSKGVQLHVLKASAESEIDAAFATLAQTHVEGLLQPSDALFNSRLDQLVALASRYGVPTIYDWREYPAAGGLISYGPSLTGIWRQLGIYAGKILNGAKPADLPVEQPTRFELVVNLKTAKALGLTVPPSILARADEVIE
ncbi:MAG TPA: ABC transporter substrate-binding protein [Stellaceae bacterium]